MSPGSRRAMWTAFPMMNFLRLIVRRVSGNGLSALCDYDETHFCRWCFWCWPLEFSIRWLELLHPTQKGQWHFTFALNKPARALCFLRHRALPTNSFALTFRYQRLATITSTFPHSPLYAFAHCIE
jgi:hypothetical protein